MAVISDLLIRVGIDPSAVPKGAAQAAKDAEKGLSKADATIRPDVDDAQVRSGIADIVDMAESRAKQADSVITPDVDDGLIRTGIADVVGMAEQRAKQADATVTPDLDGDKVRSGITDVVSTAESRAKGADATVTPDVDGSTARSKIATVISKAEAAVRGSHASLTPDVDGSSVRSRIADVVSRAESMVRGANVEITPTVDEGKVRGDMASVVSAAESRAKGADPVITPEVDGDKAESGMDDLMGNLKEKAKGGAAALGAILVGGTFMDAINAEADVDKMAASLGLNNKQMARLGRVAGKVFANNWAGSVGEASEGIAAVMSSLPGFRFKGEKTLERISSKALAFADIFDVDVTRAVQIAGQMMRTGFAKNADQAFDMLYAASQRVPSAVREDLLDAVDEYGPFFRGLGFSGQEAFDVLVKASGKGMYGIDKAGDAIKEFGIRATDGSETTESAFAALGLPIAKLSNDLLAGGDTADKAFQTIVQGLLDIEDPFERSAQALKLFGTPMEDLSVQEIPKFLKSLQTTGSGFDDFSGAADKAMTQASDNTKGSITSIINTVRNGATDIIAGFLSGDWGRVGKGLTEVWNGVKTLFQKYWRQILMVCSLGIGLIVITIVDHWDSIKDFFSNVWGKIAGFFTAGFGKLKQIVSDGIGKIADYFKNTPWPQIIEDLVFLLPKLFAKALDKLKDLVLDGLQWVTQKFREISWGNVLGKVWDGIKAGVRAAWNGIKTVISTAIGKIGDFFTDTNWGAVFSAIWGAVKAVTKKIWGDLTEYIGDRLDKIRDTVSNAVGKVRDLVVNAWNKVRDATSTVWNKIRDVVDGVWDKIRNLVSNAVGKVRELVSNAWEKIRNLTSTAWGKVRTVVDGVWDKIRNLVSNAVGKVRDLVDNAWDKVKTLTTNAWDRVRQIIANVWDKVKTLVSNAVDRVKTLVSNAWDKVKTVTGNVWDSIRTKIGNIWDSIRTKIGNTIDGIRTKLANVWDDVKTKAGNVWDAIRTKIGNVWQGIKTIFGNLTSGARNLVTVFRNVKDGISTVWQKVKDVVARPVGTVLNIIEKLTDAVDKVLGFFHVPKIDFNAPKIGGAAKGGIYPGYTPGRDVGVIGVSGGEAIMRPEWTRAVGPQAVGEMNAAARSGGVSGVQRYLGGHAKGGVVWPVPGASVGTPFGVAGSMWESGYHTGTDFPAATGTPIRSVLDGKIISAGWGGAYGNLMKTATLFGQLWYAHMSRFAKRGGNVDAGDRLGYVGATGNTTGPHLHLEWRDGSGTLQDPMTLLRGKISGSGAITGAIPSIPDWVKDAVTNPFDYLQDKVSGGLDKLPDSPFGALLKAIPKRIIELGVDKLKSFADQLNPFSPGMTGVVTPKGQGTVPKGPGGAKSFAKSLFGRYHWNPAEQWPSLNKLWQAESGWNYQADNPTSSAYGIPQALASLHHLPKGFYDSHTGSGSSFHGFGGDPRVQVRWGLNYIHDRYGTPVRAWDYWKAHHSYDSGGILPPGVTMAINNTGKNEYVHTADQLAALSGANALDVLERIAVAVESGATIMIDGRQVANTVSRYQRAEARGQRVAAGTAGWS